MPISPHHRAALSIRLDRIGPTGFDMEAVLPADTFAVLKEMADAGECAFSAPIAVSFTMDRRDRIATVRGRFETRVRIPCSRCLKPVEQTLSANFRYTYAPAGDAPSDASPGDALELTREDAERMVYDKDEIDVAEAVQEEVIAALPYRILCRDGCKGLCPGCGADRNLAPCTCETHPVDPRLAILKTLKSPGRLNP